MHESRYCYKLWLAEDFYFFLFFFRFGKIKVNIPAPTETKIDVLISKFAKKQRQKNIKTEEERKRIKLFK
ncbi:hypothetical protein DFQ11_103237 [Winogradskyella epiphytica]|uniref:Uncharacterized protein n=2 Tax=Winogradskyella epiphytica TaxID=262005 RepID=A0A2V4WW25_9FLAO|nr:hypothetical protein DFQ11_103237 [Winogradskyella epiphytica]